jgi:hypothetical protein
MTARIGEYGLAGYRKHAPGSAAGAPFRNGTPFDAGSLIWIDNNISWMCRESTRQLVFCPGPGTTKTTFASNQAVHDGLPNYRGSGSTLLPHQEIPWDRRTAIRFGPFHVIADELAADGTSIPRKVETAVRVTHAATTLDLYAALTTHGSPSRLFDGEYIAFAEEPAVATATTHTMSLVPAVRIPRTAVAQWKCRRNPTGSASLVLLIELYLWIGWRPVGGGAASIDSITAWETR